MTVKLDVNLRKKIEKRRREERDARISRRLSAILWLADEVTIEEVASRLGISARQVRKWLKTYHLHGLDGLCALHYKGRKCQLTDAQTAELKQEIATGQFHTALQIVDWIDHRFGVRYSESGVKELLKRIGVSYHKVSGFMWKADAVDQEEGLDGYRCDPVGTGLSRYVVYAVHVVWGYTVG